MRVKLEEADGTPILDFTLADAQEIFGDALDQVVPWKDTRTAAVLSGNLVRLRFEMMNADLYAFRFFE